MLIQDKKLRESLFEIMANLCKLRLGIKYFRNLRKDLLVLFDQGIQLFSYDYLTKFVLLFSDLCLLAINNISVVTYIDYNLLFTSNYNASLCMRITLLLDT